MPILKAGLRAQGLRVHRRHLAVRDLQRSRGVDEELRATRASTTSRSSQADFVPLRAEITTEYERRRASRSVTHARRQLGAAAQASPRTTIRPIATRLRVRARAPEAKGEVVTGLLYIAARLEGPARPQQHGADAADADPVRAAHARRGGAGEAAEALPLIGPPGAAEGILFPHGVGKRRSRH